MLNKIRQVSLIPELRFPSKRYAGFHYSGFMVYFAPVYSIDILAKVLCTEQWNKPNVSKILNYRDCILANAPEFERVYVVSDFGKEIPWHDWRQKTPEWWTAYNKVKHDRFGIGAIGACSYLKSTLFSLDGEGWTSSNFHKYGDPFYKNGEICFENMVSIK